MIETCQTSELLDIQHPTPLHEGLALRMSYWGIGMEQRLEQDGIPYFQIYYGGKILEYIPTSERMTEAEM